MQDKINTLVKDLFEKLNIEIDSLIVTNVDKPNIFNIKIQSEESGIIIGPNGKNLDAIQNILKLMSSKIVGEKIKIHIEVNDYIKTKDDRLFDFIAKEIEYLRKTGKDIKLPFYSSYERKKIHSFIHKMNDSTISSKSIGEGKERRLYLCKQKPKLTIDIDGYDI